MTSQILTWLNQLRRQYPDFTPGRVLEVGSRDVTEDKNGSPRPFFQDATEYIGIDMEEGEGVDEVIDASDLTNRFWNAPRFNTIICCEMLEHDIDFLETVKDMHELLASGGHLIITTPTFGFPLHRFPKDYWRFGEDAFREVFFAGLDILNLVHLDDQAGRDLTIAAIGRKR